nr:MAG TPA: hypothetical protein [Caudoviricetes sp.]
MIFFVNLHYLFERGVRPPWDILTLERCSLVI